MNPCDPKVQQTRQDLLDQAFLLDRRDQPDHPHFATYTALNTTTAYECLANANPNS
jgi:hypothetical protein